MSASSTSSPHAPASVPFTLVPALEQYVVRTKAHSVWRLHAHDHTAGKPYGAVFFSEQARSRWDFASPDPCVAFAAGVMCVGRSFEAALLETFAKQWPSVLQPPPTSPSYLATRLLTPDDVDRKYMSRVLVPSGLRLFDLTAPGAMSSVGHGLDAWLTATKDYAASRTWGRWFFACPEIDGLIYSSRPGGAQTINYALFNRPGLAGRLKLSSTRIRSLRQWPKRLAAAARTLNFTVLPPLLPPSP